MLYSLENRFLKPSEGKELKGKNKIAVGGGYQRKCACAGGHRELTEHLCEWGRGILSQCVAQQLEHSLGLALLVPGQHSRAVYTLYHCTPCTTAQDSQA